MTIFNNFCCCISLRTGCLLMAILSLITSILGVISSFIGMCVSSPATVIGGHLDLAIPGFLFIMFTTMLIFSSSLLHGVLKRKPVFIMIYILFYLVSILINIILILFVHMFGTFFFGVPAFVGGIIVEVIGGGISIYILLVFYSYYLVLQKEAQNYQQYM